MDTTGAFGMTEQLKREMEAYKRLLPGLAADEGKFALIVDDDLVGTFESYADALTSGYEKAGLHPFLVKRISSTEMVAYFSRDVDLACLI